MSNNAIDFSTMFQAAKRHTQQEQIKNMSDSAIDFSSMLREAKKRAREERRRQREAAATKHLPNVTVTATQEELNHPKASERRKQRGQKRDELFCYESTTADCVPPLSRSTDDDDDDDDDDEPPPPNISFISDDDRSTILERHRLTYHNTPPPPTGINHVYYIPHCLTPEFTQPLQNWLVSLPTYHPSSSSPPSSSQNGKWTHLRHSHRNVAVFDLRPPKTSPPLLRPLLQFLITIGAFSPERPPNHVLINEYQSDEGIMPHTDGPAYDDRTATFSIGGGDVLFRLDPIRDGVAAAAASEGKREEEKGKEGMEVKLSGEGSLIVFTDEAYSKYRHSIDDRVDSGVEIAGERCVNWDGEVTRGYRISLTFRHKF